MITTQFTTEKFFGKSLVAVKANGGTVTVEKRVGNDWVVADTLTEGVYPMDLGNSPTRFTPTGGAAFEVGA